MELFFSMLLASCLSEMGDKTQLFIIAMATKYKLRDIIIGTVGAILLLNVIAVAAGSFVSSVVKPEILKFIAGAAFFAFAYSNFFFRDKEEDGQTKTGIAKKLGAALTVGILFFAAEFGDKSQLLAIGFSSSYGISKALTVFLACSLGLILADTIAFVLSYFLGKNVPEKLMTLLAGVAFLAFGALTVYDAFSLCLVNDNSRAIVYTVACVLIFLAVSLVTFVIKLNIKSKNKNN